MELQLCINNSTLNIAADNNSLYVRYNVGIFLLIFIII